MNMKHLRLFIALTLIVLVGSTQPLFASNSITIVVNGVTIDHTLIKLPSNKDNQPLVPLKLMTKALNLSLTWDDVGKKALIESEDLTLTLSLNRSNFVLNGVKKALNTPLEEKNGELMMPISFFSDYLNLVVNWQDDQNTLIFESENYHNLDDYTLLIYLNGTDLESGKNQITGELLGAASSDLKEMMAVGSNENINVIVETGGTKTWQLTSINPEKTQRFLIRENTMELKLETDKKNMGASQSLENFISWGLKNYPAKKTALILWNHGGGPIVGYGLDEWFDGDTLTLPELDQAFKSALKNKAPFSFIGFDACLMGSLETATVLSPYADYLIASQELEPETGWNYKELLSSLKNTPYHDTPSILKAIADGYQEHALENDLGDDITLSAIDLSKVSTLNTSLQSLFNKINRDFSLAETFPTLTKALSNTKGFGGNTLEQGYTNLYDLEAFANQLPLKYSDEVKQVKKNLESALVYKVSGPFNESASGLSLFIPYYNLKALDDNLKLYDQLPLSLSQKKFAKTFSEALKSRGFDKDFKDSFTIYKPEIDFPFFQIVFDYKYFDQVQDVYLRLAQTIHSGRKRLRYLGYDDYVSYDDNLQYFEDYDGSWTFLEGHLVTLQMVRSGDDFIEYEIPVLVNKQRMVLQATWIYNNGYDGTGNYEITGVRSAINPNSNMPSKKTIALKKGDLIEPIYYSYYYDTQKIEEEIGTAFTLSETFSLYVDYLEPQDFLVEFVVLDFAGNMYFTGPHDYIFE